MSSYRSTFSAPGIIAILPFLLPVSVPAMAQNFSFDGNRWYEIEVSIFSNENSGQSSELVIPDKIQLNYQQPIRQLVPASSSFEIDFESEMEDEPALAFNETALPSVLTGVIATEPASIFIGPANSPGKSDFKISDFNRDPFIALGNEFANFLEYNQEIIESNDHRLLFHALWRQPILNRVQASAIYIEGGNKFGQHSELEGSLRFSYNVNRVDVEARLWLAKFSASSTLSAPSSFSSPTTAQASSWILPDTPAGIAGSQSEDLSATENYVVEKLAYMDQERAMISNELHFLDHPDIGLLVEIRPYQLPEQSDFFD